MRKIIFVALAFIGCIDASAQQASAGFRTGFSKWKDLGNGKYSCSASWDKEAFVRFHSGGKWAFDAGLGFYSMNLSGKNITLASFPDYYDTGIKERTQNIELNLSVQYDISCSYMRSTSALQKLKSYAGVTITPTVTRNTAELQYRKTGDDNVRTTISTKDALAFWTGLNHSFVYQFNEQFYAVSMAKLEVDPYRLFEKNTGVSTSPDSRFGFQVGIGYNIR